MMVGRVGGSIGLFPDTEVPYCLARFSHSSHAHGDGYKSPPPPLHLQSFLFYQLRSLSSAAFSLNSKYYKIPLEREALLTNW